MHSTVLYTVWQYYLAVCHGARNLNSSAQILEVKCETLHLADGEMEQILVCEE
jgi:hypothetical protein